MVVHNKARAIGFGSWPLGEERPREGGVGRTHEESEDVVSHATFSFPRNCADRANRVDFVHSPYQVRVENFNSVRVESKLN